MQIKHLPILLAPWLLLPNLVFGNIQVEQPIPEVAIEAEGEILVEGDDIRFEAWSTGDLNGRVIMIQHIAGRSAAKELNAPMIDAIIAAKLSADQYQTVTVINLDDAMWGTSGMVKGKAEDSKREFPRSSMVLDKQGLAQTTWDLEQESSAIILLDPTGKVLFMKDGELNQTEIDQVITLINENLPQ